MKILVTGASGFIAGALIEELLKQGHQVIATSRSKDKFETKSWFKKVVFLEYIISNQKTTDNLYEFFLKPDILIHLAWSHLPDFKTIEHITQTLPAHKFFIKNLVQNGLKDILVSGTCLEYGVIEGELKEDLLVNPTISYAIAKNELRVFLENLREHHFFTLKWIRLFYIYGEGQNPSSIYSQMLKAIKERSTVFNMSLGEQERDYLKIQIIVENIVKIALQNDITGIINCCSGRPVKIKEFVQNFFDLHNYPIKLNLGFHSYLDYEPFRFWGNIDKLQKITNPNEFNRKKY